MNGGENMMVEENQLDQEEQQEFKQNHQHKSKTEPVKHALKSLEVKKEGGSDRFWKTTTVVLIVLLGFFLLRGNNSAAPTGGGVIAGEINPSPTVQVDMAKLVDDDPFLGDENAPVTVIEFSDYECPFCARFYQQTLPQIKSNYIKTGKVRFVFRDFPLSFHPQAEPAAIAANCAGEQGQYWKFHDLIFNNGGAAGKTGADYKRWVQELSLDVAKWEKCLSDPAQKQEVQKDFRDGGAAGITGTPGFIINGQLVSGAQPFSVFQQVIEATLN